MATGRAEDRHVAYFTELRDFWWNLDHLDLCARRFGLDQVRDVLDVGAGVGHWGRLLSHVLPPDAAVTGVDREQGWIDEARSNAEAAGLDHRFTYTHAHAEELPFEDASFDLVTCQTVLIHVQDPRAAIREMIRVVRPGGLVLASEPCNRAAALVGTTVSAGASVDETVDLVRFYLTCERGKIALGDGDSSMGDLVPGMFGELGLEDIQVYMSDKAFLMVPPFEGEEQEAVRATYEQDAERGGWGFSREEARHYYIAGGGDEAEFEHVWARRMGENRAIVDAIEEGSFSSAGGQVLYVIGGRRPR